MPSRPVRPDDSTRPVCTIVGGPNGSGKSTVYGRLCLPGRFLNADVTARRINPGTPADASLAAGRHVVAELSQTIGARQTFAYETTLSSHQSIRLMRIAKQAGYTVGLVFMTLNNVGLNIERVAERVARGGHDIPEEVIRRRYETALQRLPDAIRIADGSILLDNSASSGPELLMRIRAGVIEQTCLAAANPVHRRIAEAVQTALQTPNDAVFKTVRPG